MPSVFFQKTFSHLFSIITCLFFSHTLLAATASGDDFPGRIMFPQVNTLSSTVLHNKIQKDEVIVVDVRSEFEFNTLNIVGSIHVPVAKKTFTTKIQELRNNSHKQIVFYCNGRTCLKSYKATVKAIKSNINNCYTYDAGIFEWALKYPDFASLLGESPVKENQIISKEEFSNHLLSVDDFEKGILQDNTKVYDVRDREQRRGGSGLFMFRDKSVSLDNTKKLKKIIAKAIQNNETLYFYDMKGKQVRWLQYFLKKEGLEQYFFMKGGAGAYYKILQERQGL
ncbi:MAG: rhodanese-like domain-containing protein [Gammaproteobacteria bacterium]|nr:rhodanese-like domain-containing protein [Gammaproteobacteria bacterium]